MSLVLSVVYMSVFTVADNVRQYLMRSVSVLKVVHATVSTHMRYKFAQMKELRVWISSNIGVSIAETTNLNTLKKKLLCAELKEIPFL